MTPEIASLASLLRLRYETAMSSRPAIAPVKSSQPAFAAETLRALSSTLLLLGLIGDRRVR